MFPADIQGVLLLQEDVLAELEAILKENSDETDWTPYENLNLSAGAFGGSDKAGSLGFHHLRAHQVVADTIHQMIAELRDFAEGVRNAADAAKTADTSAADDLTRRAAEVHDTDQNAYHHARNDQTVVPVDPTPGQADGISGDTGGQP
jgi:hypothetical protein